MAFLGSPAPIYNVMQHKGVLAAWVKEDYNSIFTNLLNMGFEWDANTERLILPNIPGARKLQYNTPWCHAKGTPKKNCGMDHHVCFNRFHIIPPRCLNCWKVVVTPNNFKQLCQLETVQKNMNVPSKCGIELRDYTPKHYGGYFYNHSIDEGRERYEQVRRLVDNEIEDGKELSVILKRGCTEYEMIKGPSVYWHNTRDEEEMLELIDAFVDMPRSNVRQSEMVKNNVRLKWALWAHANGDFTYKELNNGESLFPDYVKYHEGDLDAIKQDLATAHLEAREGVPVETGQKLLKYLNEFSKDNDIPLDNLGSIYKGTEQVSLLEEIHPMAKGEHDELT